MQHLSTSLLRYSSDCGSASCIKSTGIAFSFSNSLTSQEPIMPVPPVTKTRRPCQNSLMPKPSKVLLLLPTNLRASARHAMYPCIARIHHVGTPLVGCLLRVFAVVLARKFPHLRPGSPVLE